jgi:rsbT co-antagonist protein RsbR
LSTPLIPLGQGLVVLPLVGELDSDRMERLRANLVEGLHASSARVALLDLTGVSRLDPELAPGLVRAAQASRLVGARVVITGLQPELARPLAGLDLNLEGLDMARTLREGIDRAFELLGPQLDASSNSNWEHKR